VIETSGPTITLSARIRLGKHYRAVVSDLCIMPANSNSSRGYWSATDTDGVPWGHRNWPVDTTTGGVPAGAKAKTSRTR
jgi:hypothetical protein